MIITSFSISNIITITQNFSHKILYMEKEVSINKSHQMQNFDGLQISSNPFTKDKIARLLEQKSPETIYAQNRSNNLDNSYKDQYYQGVSYENYCYPSFISKIGSCCIPFKICCPFCFCECCLCKSNPLFQQPMHSLGLLQQWGHFQKILSPGLHIINPISQSVIQINQQTKMLEYNQIGISKDNVQFNISVVVFYRVFDSQKLAYRLGNYDTAHCLTQLSIGTLRSVLGQNLLQTIIQNRGLITQKFTGELNRQVSYWGIYVQVCSLKQMKIDEQIKNALQMVTKTKRLSEAMLINYRADIESGKLIKQISQIIDNKASFQIRYLNTIENILLNNHQNIIFMKMSIDQVYAKQI